jgi:hypothetical protein
MARDEAYRQAEQRIEEARRKGETQLDLSLMGLTEVPEAIANLTQLQELDLSINLLTALPKAIAHLTQLQLLVLSDNPLNSDLAAAYEQGTQAVLQYLRVKAEVQVTLNEAKLILGVYELDLLREWLVKAAPYLKILTGTLSLVLPVAASTTKLILDENAYKGVEEQLDLGQKSLESALKGGELAVDRFSQDEAPDWKQGRVIRAHGAVLRELHVILKEKDPSFGGLVRVQNKRREFLWVHEQFVGEY